MQLLSKRLMSHASAMLAYGRTRANDELSLTAIQTADSPMISRMRLVLAVSVLLTAFVDPSGFLNSANLIWVVFAAHILYSVILCIASQLNNSFFEGKATHWLDVGWCILIIHFTGGIDSIFFLFFFFAILTASFSWGFEEGARVTIASVTLFVAYGLFIDEELDLSRLLLRSTFLLSIGYMSAHWGESKLGAKRRLALLREVSRLSNPRFGIDHTITSVLNSIRAFFRGSSCILVMQDRESGVCSVRTVRARGSTQSILPEPVSAEAVAPLMAFSPQHTVMYTGLRWPVFGLQAECMIHDSSLEKWALHDTKCCSSVAELLESDCFISAPLKVRKAEGRMYVMSPARGFDRADALFLAHLVKQAFTVIENIELLDCMASDAACRERQKIAWDLHDTTIQPYIGLKLGLNAIRNKASADNPLIEDLDRLSAMAAQVITELRHYAGGLRNKAGDVESAFLADLHRQAEKVKKMHGIEIALTVEGELNVSDRLTAEVLQLIREGLNNISKHTSAQRGCVVIRCACASLGIWIENESAGRQFIDFKPRTIVERTEALGGKACVMQSSHGSTIVHIDIPI